MIYKKRTRLLCLYMVLLVLSGCAKTGNQKSGGETETTTLPEATVSVTEPTQPEADPVRVIRDSVTTMPETVNPLDYTQESEAYILDYTLPGLYAAVANDTGSGYVFRPELAAGDPVDVTEAYAGDPRYGVPEGVEAGYAYSIELNPDACWQDGTPIDADTYMESLRLMLDGDDRYSRASLWYNGMLRIANAYSYCMQDSTTRSFRSLKDAGYGSVAEARNDGQQLFYLDMSGFWNLDCGWQSVESLVEFRDEAVEESHAEAYVSPKYLYETYLADGTKYEPYQSTYVGIPDRRIVSVEWDQVGLVKSSQYRMVLILEQPLSKEQLQYSLCENWLVHPELDPETYGTSVETFRSCGPFVLSELTDAGFRLERNENWYGWTDGTHAGQYGLDVIECAVYSDPREALNAFDRGELDLLRANVLRENGRQEDQTYLSKLTINSSFASLEARQTPGIHKTILADVNFRKAISLAIDRAAFVENCVPTGEPALGLLGQAYLSDLTLSECYRDTAAAQAVLDGVYAGSDTGYDPEEAAVLLQKAYETEAEAGRIQPEDVVELEFLVYSDAAVYTKITEFLQEALNTAAVGTELENRIRVRMTVEPRYYDLAKTGDFDLILSSWGGDAANPAALMRSYCDKEQRFEYGFDPSREICGIVLDGTEITKTYRGWYEALVNGKYADADSATRTAIVAGLEKGLLSGYYCVPLYERNNTLLVARRISWSLESQLPLIGLGDLRYATVTE